MLSLCKRIYVNNNKIKEDLQNLLNGFKINIINKGITNFKYLVNNQYKPKIVENNYLSHENEYTIHINKLSNKESIKFIEDIIRPNNTEKMYLK